jgi:hypothetical protein
MNQRRDDDKITCTRSPGAHDPAVETLLGSPAMPVEFLSEKLAVASRAATVNSGETDFAHPM